MADAAAKADPFAGWSAPEPAKPADPLEGWSEPEAKPALQAEDWSSPGGQAKIAGLLDAPPFSRKLAAAGMAAGDYVHGSDFGPAYDQHLREIDASMDEAKEGDPALYRLGNISGSLALPIKGGAQLAALGAATGAGDARGSFARTLAGAGMGGTVGALAHGAGALVGKAAGAATPWLQRLEARLTNQIGDKAAVEAEKTANSAMGSYRSARADANRILEVLRTPTGDAATDAANRQLLNSQQGRQLAIEVAQHAQERAPDALDRIDSLKALADQTHADIATTRAAATTDDALKAALAQRTKAQLGRYIVPAAAGAAGTAVGGPAVGAIAAGAVAPGTKAAGSMKAIVMNNLLAPERKLLATRAGLSAAEKISQLAQSNPAAAGKFAAPLSQAAARGADAIAATHFTLSQDPDYQTLMHQVAENDQ